MTLTDSRPHTPRRRSARLRSTVVGLAALTVLAAGCAGVPESAPDSPKRETTGSTGSANPADPINADTRKSEQPAGNANAGQATAPGAMVKVTLAAAIAALPVEPERRTGYDRDLFDHWVDVDGNGCDARDEALIAQNRDPAATLGRYCEVYGGQWRSYYDREVTRDPSTFDIDHLVPLAEAWDSGAYAWDADRRQAYANDLGDPRSLVAVSASSNRTKSDADPSEWMPAYGTCVYVSSWVAVKTRWQLSVDPLEKARLADLAAGCGERRTSVRVAKVAGTGPAASTTDARSSAAALMSPATAAPAGPTSTAAPAKHTAGGGIDPRFEYCTDAVAAGYGPYVRDLDPEYDWYRDGDGDGTVCES